MKLDPSSTCVYHFYLHFPVEVDREKGFHLDIEDYLAGVLIMASELVSLIIFLQCLAFAFEQWQNGRESILQVLVK